MNDIKIKLLISAGPTRERIDPVRFISNRSSGKMGYALAEAGVSLGCQVTLVSGPVSLEPPKNVDFVQVESASEMAREIRERADSVDMVIMAAAVADYRPAVCNVEKIKKNDATLTLMLERTEDILASLGGSRRGEKPLLVGFAAETENLLANARGKLKRKNLDWIIANDVSRLDAGFESDANRIVMISRNGEKIEVPLMNKQLLAIEILKILKC